MALVSDKLQMQHLAWRAGFGEPLPLILSWTDQRRKQTVHHGLNGPKTQPLIPVEVVSATELPDYQKVKDMNAEERKQVRKMNTQGVKELNLAWLQTMISSEHPLREKMALFWHGDCVCRNQN